VEVRVEIEVDPQRRADAIKHVRFLMGSSAESAEALIDAVLLSAIDQVFETILGVGAVPSAVIAVRAEQLKNMCLQAKRMLTQREVEVLFRVPATVARAIITTTNATYETALRANFLERMRSDATVTKTGSVQQGQFWSLRFSEESTYELAEAEARRVGVLRSVDPGNLTVIVELQHDGRESLELLEIPKPQ
jgi:hypothetical protein